jgi:hypothetical protein
MTGTRARSAAQRPMMPVHDVRLEVAQALQQPVVRPKILHWEDGAAHLVDRLDAVPVGPGAFHQRPLRPLRRPGNERHVVPAVVLPLARQQRVLLRPADDEARDDMDDSHPMRKVWAEVESW